ncbi:MAG: hypothetical protein JW795_15805 [Chitinivibrionales bacterium]|nr:hypothetical protein [Chitinivibrionales bacterium]
MMDKVLSMQNKLRAYGILGRSKTYFDIVAFCAKAVYEHPNDPICVSGEAGSGCTTLWRAIHVLSGRPKRATALLIDDMLWRHSIEEQQRYIRSTINNIFPQGTAVLIEPNFCDDRCIGMGSVPDFKKIFNF